MNTRINKYVAQATGLSRRHADKLIEAGKVYINNRPAKLGDMVSEEDEVKYNDKLLSISASRTIIFNKPVGYVCSRDGQGSATIYDLLPADYFVLKPIGRLDKNSSGLLLLTSDGDLAFKLTHPSFIKDKIYNLILDKPLAQADELLITDKGVALNDGLSRLKLSGSNERWQVTMHEGRNRQIRRTFEALGYSVKELHRIQFGDHKLGELESGQYSDV